jgi:hypothetical protein
MEEIHTELNFEHSNIHVDKQDIAVGETTVKVTLDIKNTA